MEQTIGEIVERDTDIVKTIGESRENVSQFTTSGGFVRSDELIIRPADLFVEFDIGRSALASSLRVLVKNAADEERVISYMCAQKEILLGRCASERDEHV